MNISKINRRNFFFLLAVLAIVYVSHRFHDRIIGKKTIRNGRYAVISIDLDTNLDFYLFYLPITCMSWRLIDFEPILMAVVLDKTESNILAKKTLEYLEILKVKVIFLKSLPFFFKDNLTGKGFLKDKTSQYEGQFLDNMKNGKGILTDFTTGTIYEGEYFKNELRGQGVHIYPNGDRYEGEVLDKKKHGKGTYVWKENSQKYLGSWVDNEMTGNGILYYPNGDRYEGQFLKGLCHGKGTFHYNNGESYSGEYVNDKRHGKGVFSYKSGDRYEGDYQNGLKLGKGTYFYANGEKYIGDINENKRTGSGIFHYKNGDYYEGEFYNGKQNGQGIYYTKKSGRAYKAIWSNGIEIKKIKQN